MDWILLAEAVVGTLCRRDNKAPKKAAKTYTKPTVKEPVLIFSGKGGISDVKHLESVIRLTG